LKKNGKIASLLSLIMLLSTVLTIFTALPVGADAATYTKIAEGAYVFYSRESAYFTMDAKGGGTAEGTNIQTYHTSGSSSQIFDVTNVSGTLYKITARGSGKAVTVAGNQKKKGANIQLNTYKGQKGQQWRFVSSGEGYFRVKNRLGYYLDIKGAGYSNGANIQLWSKNTSKGQQWNLVPASRPLDNGTYYINAAGGGKVLGVESSSVNNGANIWIHSKNNSSSQKFILEYLNNGYYRIINSGSGKVLEAASNGTGNGTNIQQNKWAAAMHQEWRIMKKGSSYQIVSAVDPTKVLDVEGGAFTDKANVELYVNNGAKEEYWTFTKVSSSIVPAADSTYSAEKNDKAETASAMSAAAKETANRASAVDYMRAMATLRWKPAYTMTYWNATDGRKWVKDITYTGVPYTQYNKTSLENFKSTLAGSTYKGPAARNKYLGNDCSSGVTLAWKHVNSAVTVTYTGNMFPTSANLRAVGSYRASSKTNTSSIVKSGNSKAVMFAAYAKLQPGDAVVYHIGSLGHTRLVTSVNTQKKTVTCIEQSGLVTARRTSWQVDKVYTFEQLYQGNYIPVTLSRWY
jgi:hypothetical protein